MNNTTLLYLAAAGLAVAALYQLNKGKPPAVNTDGSGGRPWSQVPDQSAAETARLAVWARTAQPMPDQTDAESARLLRQANPYRW